MNLIMGQKWIVVKFRGGEFRFWSGKEHCVGDSRLSQEAPKKKWKGVFLFAPTGSLDAIFYIGIVSPSGVAQILSNKTRRVKDGFFGMRVGPQNCEFFVASDDAMVQLQGIDCVDRRDVKDSFKDADLY